MGFVLRMNPCCFPNADVFAEAHISEDLAVNQHWDARSDVYLCFFGIFCFEEKLDLFGMLVFERVRRLFKYATINKVSDGFSVGILCFF